ncbi:ABC transporter ATP-binding protein [Brevibacillus nitrificans]|uniref:ABC transporter ATP-binding protein n=1 Tax=Brevibacillus nitrificans TaxID=651560 RepID=UPI002854D617|nr:ABC transporter ATP-binding protein [Brevibacillus nitrificans]MDR7318259.1 ABC-type Fe3+/spermidine/putrescine transport system ATPase subunit [Brevibacillus nitrificans]
MDILIKDLNKFYQSKQALHDIHMTLPAGSFTAIVGPSGCGKTTLMRCLAGFLQADQGTIHFGEKDVTDVSPQKRETAMVFQNYALWPHMSVFDNIAYGLKLKKLLKAQIEEKVMRMLEKVEIDTADVKKRFPTQYSGGQQQRIALARALVLEPALLLMDEPLSNLDAKVRQRLRVEIRKLQKELGITAVYVTHDQEEALSMADQVIIMNQGRIEQMGRPEELYRQPKSYFVAHFLGNSNTLTVSSRDGQYWIGNQPLPLLPASGAGKTSRLVVRGEDARISFQAEQPVQSQMQVKGVLRESLFLGAGYRHWVEVEDQSLFIDTENPLEGKGACYVSLSAETCYLFEEETLGEGRAS